MKYEFTVFENETLNGVFINDETKIIKHRLEKIPEKGTIIINSEGKWLYKPLFGAEGQDFFEINVYNEDGINNKVKIEINILKELGKGQINKKTYIEHILRIDEQYFENYNMSNIVLKVDNVIVNNISEKENIKAKNIIIHGKLKFIFDASEDSIKHIPNKYYSKMRKVGIKIDDKIQKDFVISFKVYNKKITDRDIDIDILRNEVVINKLGIDKVYVKVPLLIDISPTKSE